MKQDHNIFDTVLNEESSRGRNRSDRPNYCDKMGLEVDGWS